MKKKFVVFSILAVVALSLAACGAAAPATSAGETRTVSVNGSGSVTISPDMATVNVGVVAQAEDAKDATSENNTIITQITSVLTEMGVAESDIQTSNFSIYPMQDTKADGEVSSVTYRVENTVTVVVRDLDSLGDILDAVISAGANTIYGVQFDVADRESAYGQAIDAAMQNAKNRAQLLADAAGAQLGELQSAETYLRSGGGIQVAYAQDASVAGMGASSEVPVSPGDLEVSVDVNVVYALQ
ncbi:MAG: SIMPL domain-containing protein [Anaerolineales bacterium]|jgi:uncharacterized protein YggE